MRRLPKPVIVAIAAAAAAATIAACSSSSGNSAGLSASTSSSAGGRVTLSWWNNATADPLKGVWVSAITAHLNVTIQNVPHQNEFLYHSDATYRD
jgi:raffinose/stachyose/melibiose transport system substrate-binding protein